MNNPSHSHPHDDFADRADDGRDPADSAADLRDDSLDAGDDYSSAVDSALDQAAAEPQPESRDEALQRMAEEVEQSRQRVLIAQAELENFRKRTRKDYEDQLKYASLGLVEDLLQVRDNLGRAVAAAGQSGAEAADGLRAGVEMVVKQFDDLMGKHGVVAIPAAAGSEFDPNVHQAITQMPSDQHPAGSIAHEAVTGFTMHDRVVRPSQVIVSTGNG